MSVQKLLTGSDATAELIPARTDHCLPQFVQPHPSRLIASKAKNTLQAQSTRPVLLAGHKPHGSKPSAQRHSRPLKDDPRRHRDLMSVLPTMKVTPTCRPRLSLRPTPRTFKSLRPTATQDITAACRLIDKPLQKLLVRPRIVFSRDRIRSSTHRPTYYMWGVLASSGHPLTLKFRYKDRKK